MRSPARKARRSRVGAARRDGDGEGEPGASTSEDEVALFADDDEASLAMGPISRGGAPSRWLRFKFKQGLFLTPGAGNL